VVTTLVRRRRLLQLQLLLLLQLWFLLVLVLLLLPRRSLIVRHWSLFLRPMLLSSGSYQIGDFSAASDSTMSLWVYLLASTNTRTMHWP
jgi:hypothetical protein